jgi:DNA-directed RNA polymerase beta subunit
MKRAAEEQARMKQEREAHQVANAARAEAKAPQAETITTATGTVLPKSHEVLAGVQEAGDRADLKALHAAVKDLFSALQSKPADIEGILGKRGVKSVEELTAEQAEEIRGKLQLVVNKRLEKAKGADPAPFN